MASNDVDHDEILTLIDELVLWGKDYHAHLDPTVKIYQDSETGLSFKATTNLSAGSDIVVCSYPITLSYLNATESAGFLHHSTPFPQSFLDNLSQTDPNIIGHFFLIQQYLLREKSFWWPYIRLLPQPNEPKKLGIPIWWPDEDRTFLRGTNAEPPITTRKALWVDEWRRGRSLLEGSQMDSTLYTYDIYQWAATIFGTRSFRASLTISKEILESSTVPAQVRDHIKTDRFSLLLPILDIGNHNGINDTAWRTDSTLGLWLSNRNYISKGSQIFNFYGYKSNSELLVGYGFTLRKDTVSGFDNDVVNLKLKPTAEALFLRRSQVCHVVPTVPDEEFMFALRGQCDAPEGTDSYIGILPHGLVDLVICMIVNSRERKYLSSMPPVYCLGRDPGLLHSPLYRAAARAMFIIQGKLEYEMTRIKELGAGLREPINDNQYLAMDYRMNQLRVLESVRLLVSVHTEQYNCAGSLCKHLHYVNSSPTIEIVSLECAFGWLHLKYPQIYDGVVQVISDDQEEPLPLNWTVLLEDWDHTYWVVWLFIVWTIWVQDREAFQSSHPILGTWVKDLDEAYCEEASSDEFYAEKDEREIIDATISGILLCLPQGPQLQGTSYVSKARNFASFIAQEESFPVRYKMHDGQFVEQKVICINAAV